MIERRDRRAALCVITGWVGVEEMIGGFASGVVGWLEAEFVHVVGGARAVQRPGGDG